ncbi:hypothetical protein OH77DRAFT_1587332 [Trametes cingulata]|nr:hypothetical protein OH77DRAFT_1587332 [Trametes cingulata]
MKYPDIAPPSQARTCPNGSAGCGDGPLKREVEVREPSVSRPYCCSIAPRAHPPSQQCTGGMHCAEW